MTGLVTFRKRDVTFMPGPLDVRNAIAGKSAMVGGSVHFRGIDLWTKALTKSFSFLLEETDLSPELWDDPDLQLQLLDMFKGLGQTSWHSGTFPRLGTTRRIENAFAGRVPSIQVIPGTPEAGGGVICGLRRLPQQYRERETGSSEKVRSDVLTQGLLIELFDSSLHLRQGFEPGRR